MREEIDLLIAQTQKFFTENVPVNHFRKLRDNRQFNDNELWEKLCELGLNFLCLSEQANGFGFPHSTLGKVLAAQGKSLVNSPLLVTAGFVPALVYKFAEKDEADEFLLESFTAKKKFGVVMPINGNLDHYNDQDVVKHCPDCVNADCILVLHREENNKFSLSVVNDVSSLSITPQIMVDSRNWASVKLNNQNTAQHKFSKLLDAQDVQECFDKLRWLISFEMQGIQEALFEMTSEYLITREQFKQKIGSFQAVQHRWADAYCQLELSNSCCYGVDAKNDEDLKQFSMACLVAKIKMNNSLNLVSNEALQLHGGIGMTDEHDLGLYMKRARVLENWLGDTEQLLSRYADFLGI